MDELQRLIGGAPVPVRGFRIAERWIERTVILALSGELDMLTAPRLEEAIATADRKEPEAMIIDLTRVSFLASAGMNALVAAHQAESRTRQFGVVADGVSVRRPLILTGIDIFIMLFPTLDEALVSFAVGPTTAAS
jgi:anti-sigma B factor antagonist